MTIAQYRERELSRLVSWKTDKPQENDFDEARRMMNSFYRLCGLLEKCSILENDSRRCNSWYTQKESERACKWLHRLDNDFNRVYGLRLVCCGIYPSIGIIKEHGAFAEKISTFFYE